MPWWAWIALGTALLAAEVVVATEFWLAVIGAAALAVGLVLAVGVGAPVWTQWLAFAVLSVILAVTVRRLVLDRVGARVPGVDRALIGERGTTKEAIAAGAIGAIEVRGTTWRARNLGEGPLEAGAPVRVERLDGLVLEVRG